MYKKGPMIRGFELTFSADLGATYRIFVMLCDLILYFFINILKVHIDRNPMLRRVQRALIYVLTLLGTCPVQGVKFLYFTFRYSNIEQSWSFFKRRAPSNP